MTQSEWITSTDPQAMLTFLRESGKLSERKARLFAAACCRRVWHLLRDERSREAVEVAERYADGQATDEERQAARAAAYVAWSMPAEAVAVDAVVEDAVLRSPDAARHAAWASTPRTAEEREVQAALLRDILGNPFAAPPLIEPSWLAWNGGTIPKLAEAAYQERALPSGHLDPYRLAVLADALEDAGCDDEALLGHLRGPGPCVRGCHVVDLLTGREGSP